MNQEQAIQRVEELLSRSNPARRLSELEKLILAGAWNEEDYTILKTRTTYSESSLRSTGAALWREVSRETGLKVTKWTFKDIFRSGLGGVPVIGSCLPSVPSFFGRSTELRQLIAAQNAHIIALVGAPGVGKSTLAAQFVKSLAVNRWQCGIWKSLYSSPTVETLVEELVNLIKTLDPDNPEFSKSQDPITTLLQTLKQRNCLIVLDSAECVLQNKGYETFLRRVAEESHRSCFLLTSEEPFGYINRWALSGFPVKTMTLHGLSLEGATQLLASRGFSNVDDCKRLIESYGSNPLILELIAEGIHELFGGDIKQVLAVVTTFYTDFIEDLLRRQFERFGDLENKTILALAKAKTPQSFPELLEALREARVSPSELVQVLHYLDQRSLIEVSGDTPRNYAVNSIIRKYALTQIELTPAS